MFLVSFNMCIWSKFPAFDANRVISSIKDYNQRKVQSAFKFVIIAIFVKHVFEAIKILA